MKREQFAIGLMVFSFGLFGAMFASAYYLHWLQQLAAGGAGSYPNFFILPASFCLMVFIGPGIIAFSLPETKDDQVPANGIDLPANS